MTELPLALRIAEALNVNGLPAAAAELRRLQKENDELRTDLIRAGWRQCAVGQKTNQWCAYAESVRLRGDLCE